jgi:DNA ligase D-like protein (predicted polymerase)
VLFPARPDEEPVTKRDLLRYAAQVAPTTIPYLTRRALNLNRFPNGAGTKGFWHKELPSHAPSWLSRWDNPHADPGETRTYLVADEPAALVWAANFGALEWHAWTSRTDRPRLPTYALIDLDPGPATSFADILTLARLHRTALEHLHVRAQPKLTGRRGIQIWIPIARGPSFDETRAWVEQLWDEACRHLTLPVAELAGYRLALLERFANPRVRHRLAQVAADGSSKLRVRVLPVLRAERAAGRVPTGCATALAGWVLHLQGVGAPVTDPGAGPALAAAATDDPRAAVAGVLDVLAPGLGADAPLVDAVSVRLSALRP